MAQIRSACPYLGILFWPYLSPFWANWAEHFYGNSGDYYLSTGDENGLGLQIPTKKLAHWVELLGQPLSRNHVIEILRGEPPPPLSGKK